MSSGKNPTLQYYLFLTICHDVVCSRKIFQAQLLGVSLKAVHSYEQGWRPVPGYVERQLFFLVSRLKENIKNRKQCWVLKKCPPKLKNQCSAWEFKSGKLCWFINGTMCDGEVHLNWEEKMKSCRSCEILKSLLEL
jgi:hypothetical protein